MQPGVYEERAHAKVNLGLAVLTRRGDGYHEIETALALVRLHDDVRVTVRAAEPGAGGITLTLLKAPGEEYTPGADQLREGDENIAHRAAHAYLRRLNEVRGAGEGEQDEEPGKPSRVGVEIELVKRLPVAAGLGGGSSDAAAVLRALHEAAARAGGEGPQLTHADLQDIALGLGSDVPFFVTGWEAALARGRGERLTSVNVPELHLVLANPGVPLSAADAYTSLVGFTPRLRFDRALQRLADGLDPGWSNGLQPGVLRAHPQLRDVLNVLRYAGLKGVVMSGSGATCFGLAESAERAAEVAASIAAEHESWWVRAASTNVSAPGPR